MSVLKSDDPLVMITICAVICGAESWVEIEHYGIAKQAWLGTFLELPNGIPSHDTLERVFARLRPEPVQQCFLHWVQAVFNLSGEQLIAVDGKTLRGSYERGWQARHDSHGERLGNAKSVGVGSTQGASEIA